MAAHKEVPTDTSEVVYPNGGVFSLDDSLCSIGVDNENSLNNSEDSSINVQDNFSGGNDAIATSVSPHRATQTHTVLSFCSEASTPVAVAVSELRNKLSTAIGKFQMIEYAQDEPMVDDIIVDCSDSEDEACNGAREFERATEMKEGR